MLNARGLHCTFTWLAKLQHKLNKELTTKSDISSKKTLESWTNKVDTKGQSTKWHSIRLTCSWWATNLNLEDNAEYNNLMQVAICVRVATDHWPAMQYNRKDVLPLIFWWMMLHTSIPLCLLNKDCLAARCFRVQVNLIKHVTYLDSHFMDNAVAISSNAPTNGSKITF